MKAAAAATTAKLREDNEMDCPPGKKRKLVPSSVSNEWEGVSRMAGEEVESLLNMKMAGKSKFDLKGRNEQMMEYIKALRNCIRKFLQVESAYVLQEEQLKGQLQEAKEKHGEAEGELRKQIALLETQLSEQKQLTTSLVDKSSKLESEKEDLLLLREKDNEALQSAANERVKLLDEIDKLQKDVAGYNQQITNLQDINRRLQEYNTSLQHYNSKLQSDAAIATEENAKTQKEKAAIVETLGALRGNYSALQTQHDTTKVALQEEVSKARFSSEEVLRLRAEIQYISEERDKCSAQLQALTAENAAIREKTSKSAEEIEIFTNKAVELEKNYERQLEQIRSLTRQLDRSKEMLEVAEKSLAFERKEASGSTAKLEALQQKLADTEQQLREGEMLRRKLHNTIQELKGNIRVFCRVRPMLADENDGSAPVVQYPNNGDHEGIELLQPQGQTYSFSFDRVFGPEVGQSDVFTEISQLVQSALDGYKVCIFAYGQTGSGKTHTMIGQPDDVEQRGMIPRSLEQIFQSSQALCCQGWSFKMQASMLEIYNETIRDLLCTKSSVPDAPLTPAKQYTVKHEPTGTTLVSDLTIVEVNSWKEVSSLLKQAAQSRTVGKTAMNDRSSRSHCVFTLRITGTNENTEQQVHGVLNLIDLAGSERLSRTGATGERLKETQAINKSLSCLGDVILAIANKDQHIPYRNSKLTYLLQPCLGGDSKTLMFVNVSPDPKSLNESICSLRFAAKVNACEIGIPRRHAISRAQPCSSS